MLAALLSFLGMIAAVAETEAAVDEQTDGETNETVKSPPETAQDPDSASEPDPDAEHPPQQQATPPQPAPEEALVVDPVNAPTPEPQDRSDDVIAEDADDTTSRPATATPEKHTDPYSGDHESRSLTPSEMDMPDALVAAPSPETAQPVEVAAPVPHASHKDANWLQQVQDALLDTPTFFDEEDEFLGDQYPINDLDSLGETDDPIDVPAPDVSDDSDHDGHHPTPDTTPDDNHDDHMSPPDTPPSTGDDGHHHTPDPMPDDDHGDHMSPPDTPPSTGDDGHHHTPDPMPDDDHGDHMSPPDTPPSTGDDGHHHTPDPTPDDGHDGHDSHDGHAPTPPGTGASSTEIRDYLKKLFMQDLMTPDHDSLHGHDQGKIGEHMAAMDLVPRANSSNVAIGSGDWFNPENWSAHRVPVENEKVLIPEGVHMSYGQVSDASLFTLRVDGKLSFATDSDSQIIFDTMVVTPKGTLEIGTKDNPVDPDVDVNLIVANNGAIDTNWDPMLLSRGVIAHGETTIHGAAKDSHEKVTTDPMAGDTSVTFAEAPQGWQVGDTIVIAGTRYDGYKWDNATRSNRLHESEDEERVITEINGNTVHFDKPLEHDHDTPRADLKTSVANYTRNVSIETENAENAATHERGHVMFMHSNDVDVRYAEFHELGRTDKSEDSFDINDISRVSADSNVQGRYALHLHRTGTDDADDPAIVIGNAVYGSPGWGFVHHDSNAILQNNASYDTLGAGYVAETGNETGVWKDNIAIKAEGAGPGGPKGTTHVNKETFDTARGGEGFWFQGRLVESTDNVAASVNTGYSYFHRDGDGRMIDVKAEHFAVSEALYSQTANPDEVSILSFSGNESFATTYGLSIIKANPNQGHDIWSHLKNFTAWEVKTGAHLQYTSHYILENFDVVGKETTPYAPADTGIDLGQFTTEVVILNPEVTNFQTGIDLFHTPVETLANRFGREDVAHNFKVVGAQFTDTQTHFDNFQRSHDVIAYSITPVREAPILRLDRLVFRDDHSDYSSRGIEINGVKIDNIGATKFPGGSDHIHIDHTNAARLLEESGYWSTSRGEKYFLIDIHTTDRLSGNIFVEKHAVYLDDSVRLDRKNYLFDNVQYNGVQNITKTPEGVFFAGDVALGTPKAITLPKMPDLVQLDVDTFHIAPQDMMQDHKQDHGQDHDSSLAVHDQDVHNMYMNMEDSDHFALA